MQLAPSVPFPAPTDTSAAAGVSGLPAGLTPTNTESENAVEFADLLPPAHPLAEPEAKKNAPAEDPTMLLWAAGCFPPVLTPLPTEIAPPVTLDEASATAGILGDESAVAATPQPSAGCATPSAPQSASTLFAPSSAREFSAGRSAVRNQADTAARPTKFSSLENTSSELAAETAPVAVTPESTEAETARVASMPLPMRPDGKARVDAPLSPVTTSRFVDSEMPVEKKSSLPVGTPPAPAMPSSTGEEPTRTAAKESEAAVVMATLPETGQRGMLPRVRWTPPSGSTPLTADEALRASDSLAPESTLATDRGEFLSREVGKTAPQSSDRPAVAEKIAARAGVVAPTVAAPEMMRQKYFLSASRQIDATQDESVGIDVANDQLAMPSLAPNRSSPASVAEKSVFPTVEVTSAPAMPGSGVGLTAEKPLSLGNVRETMAAVVTAVEALENRALAGPSVVNLHFQVGAEKLALHLELHDGTMHTTFRTDSAELRAALGQEWQAAAPGLSTRDVTIATPVFASAAVQSADLAQSSAGQGQPQQRGQHAPEPQPFFPGRATAGVSTPTSAPAATPAAAPSGSASLLHAFA